MRSFRCAGSCIHRIAVMEDRVCIDVRTSVFKPGEGADTDGHDTITIDVPATLKKCGHEVRLIIKGPGSPAHRDPDTALINLLGRAHDWFGRLASGASRSIQEIATAEGVSRSYAGRVVHLALLDPGITQKIVQREHPEELTAERLMQLVPLPEDWQEQRRLLGVD